MRRSVAVALVVAVVGGPHSAASAGPLPDSTYHYATKAVLSDRAGDIARSDGNSTYEGKDIHSTRIHDYTDETVTDIFQFQPWRQRFVQIDVDPSNAEMTACHFSSVRFTSSTTTNWYALQPGQSTLGDARFLCLDNGLRNGWYVDYGEGATDEDDFDCTRITRVSQTQWEFKAPAYTASAALPLLGQPTAEGCPATVTVAETGARTEGASAPLTITADVAL